MFEKVNPSHPDKLCDRIAGKVAVHYVEVAQSGETEAAEFEQFDGDPINHFLAPVLSILSFLFLGMGIKLPKKAVFAPTSFASPFIFQ